MINNFIDYLFFIFQRLNWLSILDIILVAGIFFSILMLLRDTQAMVLLRGVLLLIALLSIISSQESFLPAFSWLVSTTLPALLLVIPVIFAPEIRRGLERLGRAGSLRAARVNIVGHQRVIDNVVSAARRLSDRKHGALIILQRLDNLNDYSETGVQLQASATSELLLQIFFPNTPLHDGAAIISGDKVVSASCVLPLSSSGILVRSPEREMGLRHRAALGISEVTDAIAVVVSEENGSISVAHAGRIIGRLDSDRLANILHAFFGPKRQLSKIENFFYNFLPSFLPSRREPRG